MVTVEFSQFLFTYSFQHVPMSAFQTMLVTSFQENKAKIEGLTFREISSFPYYIVLGTDQATTLGLTNNIQQMKSNEALLFHDSHKFYKIPVSFKEYFNLAILREMHVENFIQISQIPGLLYVFHYDVVKYDPLSAAEARLCLGDLVPQIHSALTHLKRKGFCHCDLRLENICFDEEYRVKIIDLDRCVLIPGRDDSYFIGSCMYNLKLLREGTMDWLQLGCIILWVISSSIEGINYHEQNIENFPIVANKFLIQLWDGIYNEDLFEEFKCKYGGCQTVKEVLQSRSEK